MAKFETKELIPPPTGLTGEILNIKKKSSGVGSGEKGRQLDIPLAIWLTLPPQKNLLI